MTSIHARNVIIGAGAMGLAAAYQLTRRGESVLLLEQFASPFHDAGSSHSRARITRHSYDDVRYARLMVPSFAAWRALEADAGTTLYFRTGGASLAPPGVDYVAQVASSLEAVGVPHARMTGGAFRERHPRFALPRDYQVVFEPDAGIIAAQAALTAFFSLAAQQGGERFQFRPQARVARIDLEGDRPVIVAGPERITADRVIVSSGAWVAQLLPALPLALAPTLQKVFYFRPKPSDDYTVGALPVFIFKGGSHEWDAFYGLPSFGGLGVKVARHGGPRIDPDHVDRTIRDDDRETVRAWLRIHLPGLAEAPIDTEETCLYTMSPDENFVVDFLPGRTDVIVASPCSGHGFKFSCLVGRVLADLAITGATELDIAPWAISVGA